MAELDAIIGISRQENSPLGIFAYVYRRTTAGIAKGIREGRFDDAARMESFDVDFARRYIDAYLDNRDERPVTAAWEVAFNAAEDRDRGNDPIILQHLLLGMNAHINLDLGIAAAGIAPGEQIHSLKDDFMTVNSILAGLTDEMQDRIGRASPMLFLLDWLGHRNDESVVNFSIEKAREFAWKFAKKLARTPDREQEALIRSTDRKVSAIGNLVANPPGFLLPKVLGLIRYFEENDTRLIIEKLEA